MLSSKTNALLTHTLASFWRKQSCLIQVGGRRWASVSGNFGQFVLAIHNPQFHNKNFNETTQRHFDKIRTNKTDK